jgi:hypothetical protein
MVGVCAVKHRPDPFLLLVVLGLGALAWYVLT